MTARPLRRVALWAGALALLLAVYASYFQPDLVMTLANQVWNCF